MRAEDGGRAKRMARLRSCNQKSSAPGSKEKVEVLLELYKGQLDYFKNTQQTYARKILALWGLIVAAGAFMYGKKITLPFGWKVGAIAGILLLMYLWWRQVANSMNYDKHLFASYRNRVLEIVGAPSDGGDAAKEPGKRHWLVSVLVHVWRWLVCDKDQGSPWRTETRGRGQAMWIVLHLVFTAMLLVVVLFVIVGSPKATAQPSAPTSRSAVRR